MNNPNQPPEVQPPPSELWVAFGPEFRWDAAATTRAELERFGFDREHGVHRYVSESRYSAAEQALRNCLAMAGKRRNGPDAEWWAHVRRFCAEAGVVPNILRAEEPSNV